MGLKPIHHIDEAYCLLPEMNGMLSNVLNFIENNDYSLKKSQISLWYSDLTFRF